MSKSEGPTSNQAPSDDLVPLPLRVSRERKARWVQLSRADGKKLTDWIVERVERDTAAFDTKQS